MPAIIDSLQHYPGLKQAIVPDTNGRILAHSQVSRRNLYLNDMPGANMPTLLQRGGSLVDVAGLVVDKLVQSRPATPC